MTHKASRMWRMCAVALVLSPIHVYAQEARIVTTEGEITFTAVDEDGNGEETVVIDPIPEEGPDVDLHPTVPGSTGPLTIAKVPEMNFGRRVISNQLAGHYMIAELEQLTGTTGDDNRVPYVSMAQVQDTRGTNVGWHLQAQLTDFTSNSQNNILRGAEVELVSGEMRYDGNEPTNAPLGHSDGLRLVPGTGNETIMRADATKGAGTSTIVWGSQSDLNQQAEETDRDRVENQAIRLWIPGSTATDSTTYQATITWLLSNTPDGDM